jgi:hypothetical protein
MSPLDLHLSFHGYSMHNIYRNVWTSTRHLSLLYHLGAVTTVTFSNLPIDFDGFGQEFT